MTNLSPIALALLLAACGATTNDPDPSASSTRTGGQGGTGSSGAAGGNTSSGGNTSAGGDTSASGNASSGGSGGSAACPSEIPSGSCPDQEGLECDYVDEGGCLRRYSCRYFESSSPVWVDDAPWLDGACENPGTTCDYSDHIGSTSLLVRYTCGEDSTWQQPLCPPTLPETGDACPDSEPLRCRYELGCSNGVRRRGTAACGAGACSLDGTPCLFLASEWEFEEACP